MASFQFNIVKAKTAYYAGLPAANDALVAIPIEASGVEADAVIVDYDTVAAILAAATNEQTTMGRKVLANVAVTTDDANNLVKIDCDDPVWTAATGNAVSDLLVAYDPDTTGGTDADLIPMYWFDCSLTPDGTDFTAQINASGLFNSV